MTPHPEDGLPRLSPQEEAALKAALHLARALAAHLGGCRVALARHLASASPPAAEWALDVLGRLLAQPASCCPHAEAGTAVPIVAAAWSGGISCGEEACLRQAAALPACRGRGPCDRCGARRGRQARGAAIVAGGCVLLASLCEGCLGIP